MRSCAVTCASAPRAWPMSIATWRRAPRTRSGWWRELARGMARRGRIDTDGQQRASAAVPARRYRARRRSPRTWRSWPRAGLHGERWPAIAAPPSRWSTAPPLSELPGFAEGRVSVQDSSAQLAAVLLDPQPGERVLDACAAPGGKTGALLELGGGDRAHRARQRCPAPRARGRQSQAPGARGAPGARRPRRATRAGGTAGPSMRSCSMPPVPGPA